MKTFFCPPFPPAPPPCTCFMLSSELGMWRDLEISGGVGGSIQISSSEKRCPGYLAYLIDLQLQNSSTVTKFPRPDTLSCMILFSDTPHTAPHLAMGFFHRDSGQSAFCAARFASKLILREPLSTHQPIRSPTPPSPTPTPYSCSQSENQVQ